MTDRDHISWTVDLTVKAGQTGKLRAITEEMLLAAHEQPGTLRYERWFNATSTAMHAVETYVSSDAAIAHLDDFDLRFRDRFLTLVERNGCWVYGTPTAQLRLRLLPLNPIFFPDPVRVRPSAFDG